MRRILFLIVLAGLGVQAPARAQEVANVEWGPWWVLLPIAHPDGVQRIDRIYAPEKKVKSQRAKSAGPNLRAVFRGRGKREIRWFKARKTPAQEPDFGPLNFLELVEQAGFEDTQAASQNAVAYAYRSLTSSVDQELDVTFGSDDSCRIWMNGRLIHDLVVARALDPASDRLTLKLKKGLNHLFVKVSNGGGGWGAQLQLRRPRTLEARPAVSPDAINEAIGRGVVYLLQTQLMDGSWAFDQANFRNGQTSLATYALLKSGLTPDHPAVQRAFAFLAVHPPIKTYSLVCQLLALHSTKRSGDRERLLELGEELMDWEDHGFSYPIGGRDLSNTQYGALGMWVFLKDGGRVSERVWSRVLAFTLDCQGPEGGFGYRSGKGVSGAMTVAGLMTIRACELGLEEAGIQNGVRREVEQACALGLSWLDDHFRVDRNPATTGANRWNYYYLYGVERMAALMDLDIIAGLDWYQEGASYLVGAQAANGSWSTAYGEGGPNTSFALLFLSRSTATLSGKRKFSRHQRRYISDDPGAEIVLCGTGDTPLSLWFLEIQPQTLKLHSRAGVGGDGLYIEHVEYLSDGVVIHSLDPDPRHPWNKERFAFQHQFKTRGFHELELRLYLVPDPAKVGVESVVLSSPPMQVRVDGLMEPWMLDYPDDELDNLGSLTEVSAFASSQLADANQAAWAVDGGLARGWACSMEDADPTLTLEYKRALRADRVVLSQHSGAELTRLHSDRATRVELLLNGRKKPLEYDLDPNPEHKSVLMLPKEMRVSELRIRILERVPGKRVPGSVGFAEVELRLGD